MTCPWYDVIIVGGGPAGTTAGYRLAQRGRQVLILDKAGFPREKPCGGGLTARILSRFPHLQQPLADLIVNRAHTIQLYAPDLSCLRYTYHEPITLMVRRSAFDAMLLDQCRRVGATVRTAAEVTRVAVAPGGVDVMTRDGAHFHGQVLIGADGVHGLVARQVGLRNVWQHDHCMAGVVTELPRPLLDVPDAATISIVFGRFGLGYGWVFPKQDVVNIGIAQLLSVHERSIQTVYQEFLRLLQQLGAVSSTHEPTTLRGGLIPVGGVMPCTQADRVLICGDAAGFVHGITGEGIYYAMISGDLAAKTLEQALQKQEFSASLLQQYQAAWQAEIGKEIAESVRIQQQLLVHPHLLNTLVRTIAKHEGMKRAFTDYFMGKVPYSALKQSLLRHFFPHYVKLKMLKLLAFRLGL